MRKKEKLQLFAEAEAEQTGVEAADAGQRDKTAQPETGEARLSWQDIMADAEYKREYDNAVQSIIKKRLRGRQEAEERLTKLEPILRAVSRRYAEGESIETLDAQMLAEKILGGENAARRERAREHLGRLMEQEKQMREKYPNFDLKKEMENGRFVALTAPHTGLSLEEAYHALHYDSMREEEARKSLDALTRAFTAGQERPREISGRQSASRSVNDPRNMSREQREALKKRIYEAKAQGKKLPYGG